MAGPPTTRRRVSTLDTGAKASCAELSAEEGLTPQSLLRPQRSRLRGDRRGSVSRVRCPVSYLESGGAEWMRTPDSKHRMGINTRCYDLGYLLLQSHPTATLKSNGALIDVR